MNSKLKSMPYEAKSSSGAMESNRMRMLIEEADSLLASPTRKKGDDDSDIENQWTIIQPEECR